MAFTETDFSLTAGFTSANLLAKVGEVFADIGIMANATAWFDSFTDTSSSEVRIIEQTQGTGTYNTLYHAFFVKAAYDGLWYTQYYNWDVTTHESLGTASKDHVSTYEHPDDVSTSSWGNYYTKIGIFTTASDLTIKTYRNAGDTSYVRFANGSEYKLMGVIPSSVTGSGQTPRTIYGPNTVFGLSTTGGSVLCILQRSEHGAWHANGAGSNDFTANPTYTGMSIGGGQSSGQLFGILTDPWNFGLSGIGNAIPQTLVGDRYDGVANIPIMRTAYSDASLGANLVYVFGNNAGSFTPTANDKFIVTAGVEEYLIHDVNTSLTTNADGYEFVAVCLRTV